jgi:hypothetical protein
MPTDERMFHEGLAIPRKMGCLRAVVWQPWIRKLIELRFYLLTCSSFFTVSALSPTLAIASAISSSVFPKNLRQWRAKSGVDISTRFRSSFGVLRPELTNIKMVEACIQRRNEQCLQN